MRSRLIIVLGLVIVGSLASIAGWWYFGPGPTPEEVVQIYFEAVRQGEKDTALNQWEDREQGEEWTAQWLSPSRDWEVVIGEITYWTVCCEPVQLSSSWNAPGARVQITLTRGTRIYPTTCYLGDVAHAPWLAIMHNLSLPAHNMRLTTAATTKLTGYLRNAQQITIW